MHQSAEKWRLDFPMLSQKMHGKPLVYLDTAATSQKPQVVIDAFSNFYAHRYATVHRAIYELSLYATQDHQEARQKVKQFLNASKVEEIVFTRGTTEAINLVAYSFGKGFIKPGDEVIISEIEHHSNIVPWQMMCEERGAVLRVIPVDDRGCLDMLAYGKLLSFRTKIVAIGHVSNALGTIHPIKEIIDMAHAKGAKVLVDGAQAAPHMVVDVKALDVDFYVFSGHKLYGPTGIGVLYGKEELLNAMPPYQGGGDMIESVSFVKTEYNVAPLRFEAGTPSIAEAVALGVAIDYIQNIGLDNIRDWEEHLLHKATASLQKIDGLKIIGNAPQKASIISFVVEGIHHLDIGTMLDLQGIAVRTGHLCAQPAMRRYGIPGITRASFALYNTESDVDCFVNALERVIKNLR